MDPIENNIIFCFWTGRNEMSAGRKYCMENLRNNCGCNLKFITVDMIQDYVLPEAPFHEAFQYLSDVHKADYLRTYFMHYYGGGYSDIKATTGSGDAAFDEFRSREDLFITS